MGSLWGQMLHPPSPPEVFLRWRLPQLVPCVSELTLRLISVTACNSFFGFSSQFFTMVYKALHVSSRACLQLDLHLQSLSSTLAPPTQLCCRPGGAFHPLLPLCAFLSLGCFLLIGSLQHVGWSWSLCSSSVCLWTFPHPRYSLPNGISLSCASTLSTRHSTS